MGSHNSCIECPSYSGAVLVVSFCKKAEIISKENVGYLRAHGVMVIRVQCPSNIDASISLESLSIHVSLSDSPRGLKEFSSLSIDMEYYGTTTAGHDEGGKLGGKV